VPTYASFYIATTLGQYILRSSHWFVNLDTSTVTPKTPVSKCIYEAATAYTNHIF